MCDSAKMARRSSLAPIVSLRVCISTSLFTSCHAKPAKFAVIEGEVQRLARTNDCDSKFQNELNLFESKLRARGLPSSALVGLQAARQYGIAAVTGRLKFVKADKPLIFACEYFHGAEELHISAGIRLCLKHISPLQPTSLTCFRSASSLFKLRVRRCAPV